MEPDAWPVHVWTPGAALLEGVRFLQLMQAQRRGDVGQVVFEARRHDLVVPARHLGREAVEGIAVHAVQTHGARALRHRRVTGHQHPAFAGGDGLVGVEAEHRGVAVERADELAAAGGGQRVRGVFHHLQVAVGRQLEQRSHVGGQAGVVHRHDGLGARRDRFLDRGGVDVQRRRVDVDQLHVGTQVAHHLGGGGEGVGGRDDLVAGADAQGLQRQVQAGGGGIDGHRMQRRVTEKGPEILFEALRLGAGGDPAALQRIDDLGNLVLADLGQGEGEEGRAVGGQVGGHVGLSTAASGAQRPQFLQRQNLDAFGQRIAARHRRNDKGALDAQVLQRLPEAARRLRC